MNKYCIDYEAHGVECSSTTVKAESIENALHDVKLWFEYYYQGVPNVEVLSIYKMEGSDNE